MLKKKHYDQLKSHLATPSPRSSISSSSFLDRRSTSATPMQSPRTLTAVLQRSLKDTNHRAEDMCFFTLCCLISAAKTNLQQPLYNQQEGSVPRRNPNDGQNEESGDCSCSWDPCFSYAGHCYRRAAEETQISALDRDKGTPIQQHVASWDVYSSGWRERGRHCIYPLSSYTE